MTFSLDSLAMEAAHAALALADSTNVAVADWAAAAPPQIPFNYAWGRPPPQTDSAAAATLNETMEAARRGRGRPKKEIPDGVGHEAAKNHEKKPPPIRGRGRPPRAAESNALYDKFPLPPGLQATAWPPSAPSYLRLLGENPGAAAGVVDLTRGDAATQTSGSAVQRQSNASFGANCCSGNDSGCQPGSTVLVSSSNSTSSSSLQQSQQQGDRISQHHQTQKLHQHHHPTYAPTFSPIHPGPPCFPGKQLVISTTSAPVVSAGNAAGNASGPTRCKVSPSSAASDKNKQLVPVSEAGVVAIPKPIMLGGTNVGCPICFKIFGSKGLLTQHMLVHTDVRKHACIYCDKAFKQQSHLKAHVRIHTGDRPYKCTMPDCDRDFVQMANLQFHLRNHDAQSKRAAEEKTGFRERVRCPICYKAFDSALGLERHMYDFHEPAVIDQELSLSNSNESN